MPMNCGPSTMNTFVNSGIRCAVKTEASGASSSSLRSRRHVATWQQQQQQLPKRTGLRRNTAALLTTTTTRTTMTTTLVLLRGGSRSTFSTGRPQSVSKTSFSSTTTTSTGGAATNVRQQSGFSFGFADILAWYSHKLDTYPLITKCLSSGLIAGAGDFLCQAFVDSRMAVSTDEETTTGNNTNSSSSSLSSWWDAARTGRFALLGGFLVAPCIHVWYGVLASWVPGTGIMAVIQRVIIDQFVYTPTFIPVWLTALWSLEGERDTKVLRERLGESYPNVMKANWTLWIPAQAVNFRFVPVKYQVLYSNVVSLLWNVYLSFSQARKGGEPLKEVDEVVST